MYTSKLCEQRASPCLIYCWLYSSASHGAPWQIQILTHVVTVAAAGVDLISLHQHKITSLPHKSLASHRLKGKLEILNQSKRLWYGLEVLGEIICLRQLELNPEIKVNQPSTSLPQNN